MVSGNKIHQLSRLRRDGPAIKGYINCKADSFHQRMAVARNQTIICTWNRGIVWDVEKGSAPHSRRTYGLLPALSQQKAATAAGDKRADLNHY